MVNSESSNERYQVWLGSETQLPSCQCMDYRKSRLPCKHICAVVSLPDVGWQSLGASFNNHPLFKLDDAVVAKPVNAQSSTFQTTDNIHYDDVLDNHCDVHDNNDNVFDNDDDGFDNDNTFYDRKRANRERLPAPSTNVPVDLKKRKGNKNNRAKIIATLKALHDELYIVTDKQVLAKLGDMINEALLYARVNHPAENDLPLKDKTLSPRKGKKRKANNLQQSSSDRSSLSLRAKKIKKKRYGIGADKREKASNLTILSNGSIKRTEKESKKPCTIDLTNMENDKLEDKTSHWLTVEGINLTSKSQAVLINHNGWLGDDHMDAAQRLLKKHNPTIAGINDIVLMTYFQRGKLEIATNAGLTIQCHNIGGHWVVSSSSKGCVTVYESLSTGLNKTLLQQLAHLYQFLCADGQLTVTVVLQQLQKGISDCGLFCIANATALAHGINPTSVTWDQSKMRKHLAQCFLNNQLEVFPHEASCLGKQTKVYKLKIKS